MQLTFESFSRLNNMRFILEMRCATWHSLMGLKKEHATTTHAQVNQHHDLRSSLHRDSTKRAAWQKKRCRGECKNNVENTYMNRSLPDSRYMLAILSKLKSLSRDPTAWSLYNRCRLHRDSLRGFWRANCSCSRCFAANRGRRGRCACKGRRNNQTSRFWRATF